MVSSILHISRELELTLFAGIVSGHPSSPMASVTVGLAVGTAVMAARCALVNVVTA